MKYDRLYNFISPVTGKLPIDRGYTLLGDKDGRSFVSPILIDVRQDIIDLKRKIGNFEELKKLDHNRIWIGDYDNEPVEQLNIGIINLPPLAEAVFPNPISPIIGDFRIPNPTFDYLSPFDWVMSGPFLPQIYATKYDTFGNPIGTDISSSLAMTQVRAAQIMKRFDNANFIVGSSTVTFAWENPKMYLIPEPLKQLYGLGTTYTFTKAQSLGNLQTGLLKNTVNNATGTLSTAIAGKDYVEVAAPIANMQLALIRPELIQEGQDVAKLLSRVERLPVANMPELTSNKLWMGDITNTAVEIQEINLENLPPLHQTIVPNPTTLDLVGQVYEGTVSGVPKVSNIVGEIFGDVALINLRFASAKFVLNDGNIALQTLMPSSQFLSNVTSGLPIQISTNLSTPGKIEVAELPYNYLWVGDAQGRVSSQPNIILSNLPDLTNGKIWKGDVNNRPFESDANYAPNDAKYILQTPDANLSNAQGLSLLEGGILKTTNQSNGVISIASGGKVPLINDYVDPSSLQEEIIETKAFATAEAAAAEAAAIASGVAYFAEQMFPFSVIPLVPVGASITTAIATAIFSKEDKSDHDSDITTINNRIDNLSVNLAGDILGVGLLSSPVVTAFTPNPRFTGKSYMKIPTGNTAERPSNSETGMIRYNTEL